MRSAAIVLSTALLHCAAQPSFEVASVKFLAPGMRGSGPLRGGPGTNSPGRLAGTASMKALLLRAYGLRSFQITGPAWMESAFYEIDANVPVGASREQAAAMLRTLLDERFHLAARRETRDLPVYVLVAGKGAAKLREATATGEDPEVVRPKITPGAEGFPVIAADTKLPRSYEAIVAGSDGIRYQLWARHESMQQLADRLSSQLDRPVLDETKLEAQYDFSLTWVVEGTGGNIPRTYPPPDMIEHRPMVATADAGLNLFAAVQSQLGLKLQPEKRPITMLRVDSVDRVPVGN